MKRIFIFIILIISIAFISILLTGCKKKLNKIVLNKDNFNDYIILDVDLTNFEKDSTKGFFTSYEYKGVANLEATCRLRKNVEVEDVVIKGKITTSGKCWTWKEYEFILELDKNGEAQCSKQITSGDYGLLIPDRPEISKFYSYELKEGEFFVNNILITSVSGNIYE